MGWGGVGVCVCVCVCVAKPVAVELRCHATALIDRIFFILSGNEDNHKVWTEFEFGADQTKGCGVSCP